MIYKQVNVTDFSLTSFSFFAEEILVVVCLVLLPAGVGESLLAAPLLPIVVTAAPEASVAATSSEVGAFSDVCLDSVDLSGADLNEALVRVLKAAAAASVSVVTLLGVLLPLLVAVLLGPDLTGVLLSLSLVILSAEVSLEEGVVLLEEFDLAGVVCVFAFPGT